MGFSKRISADWLILHRSWKSVSFVISWSLFHTCLSLPQYIDPLWTDFDSHWHALNTYSHPPYTWVRITSYLSARLVLHVYLNKIFPPRLPFSTPYQASLKTASDTCVQDAKSRSRQEHRRRSHLCLHFCGCWISQAAQTPQSSHRGSQYIDQ